MEFSEYLNVVEERLKTNFDIYKNHIINELCYDFYSEYHLRNEKFFLVKKAVIYAFENNEYIMMKYYKDLDKNQYGSFIENLLKSIKEIVDPTNDHMSSVVTGVLLVDGIQEKDMVYIKNAIEQFKYNKSFALGYKGWAQVRILLISLKTGLITCNKKGKEATFLYNFF